MEKSQVRLCVTALCFAVLCTSAYAEESYQRVLDSIISSDFYNRAPDVLPGTLPEMRDSSYWIAKMDNPDEIILPLEAVRQMNENYQKKIHSPDPFKGASKERIPDLDHWWPGYEMVIPDLYSMTPRAVADTVRKKIKVEIDYLRGRDLGNIQGVILNAREIDKFEHEMALDLVENDIEICPGMAVNNTLLRNVPTAPMQVGLWQNGKTRWDLFTVCMLKIGKPVIVLHTSRSGEHVFVSNDEAYGWVRSEDIAFGDKKKIEDVANTDRFVVCTGDRVLFYSDESCIYASGWFGMGTRLPLGKSNNRRHIMRPVRMTNGQLIFESAWLKEDADVSIGFLPYTRRNIVETAFKLLDNTYDWTGGWFGRNHETTYRDIFACFGFELPFHGALFTHFGSNEKVTDPKSDKQEQYRIILSNEPFATLQSCGGHAQLFIGEYDGKPIVFDQHGYNYEDEDGNILEVRRCCIGDLRLPAYFLTRPVTFLELK